MTLTDTGPLVALLDRDDGAYARCLAAAERLPPGPMLTTLCCYTEAMHLLGRVGGFAFQAELWRLRSSGRLLVQDLSAVELDRMAVLMEKYRDVPMDLADASIVAVAERRPSRTVFTIDGHFRAFRLADGTALDIVP